MFAFVDLVCCWYFAPLMFCFDFDCCVLFVGVLLLRFYYWCLRLYLILVWCLQLLCYLFGCLLLFLFGCDCGLLFPVAWFGYRFKIWVSFVMCLVCFVCFVVWLLFVCCFVIFAICGFYLCCGLLVICWLLPVLLLSCLFGLFVVCFRLLFACS